MSIRARDAAWWSGLYTGSRLTVLLRCAEYADDSGAEIFVSMVALAVETRISVRQVKVHVRALEMAGVLIEYPSPDPKRKTRTFRLNLEFLEGCRPAFEEKRAQVLSTAYVQRTAHVKSGVNTGAVEGQHMCSPASKHMQPAAHYPSGTVMNRQRAGRARATPTHRECVYDRRVLNALSDLCRANVHARPNATEIARKMGLRAAGQSLRRALDRLTAEGKVSVHGVKPSRRYRPTEKGNAHDYQG